MDYEENLSVENNGTSKIVYWKEERKEKGMRGRISCSKGQAIWAVWEVSPVGCFRGGMKANKLLRDISRLKNVSQKWRKISFLSLLHLYANPLGLWQIWSDFTYYTLSSHTFAFYLSMPPFGSIPLLSLLKRILHMLRRFSASILISSFLALSLPS